MDQQQPNDVAVVEQVVALRKLENKHFKENRFEEIINAYIEETMPLFINKTCLKCAS